MYLCDSICNVLNFSVFDHTSSGKHDVPWYGDEETDSIDVNEVKVNGELFVLIKDGLGIFVILMGSTCCTLRRTVLPFRCDMLGP